MLIPVYSGCCWRSFVVFIKCWSLWLRSLCLSNIVFMFFFFYYLCLQGLTPLTHLWGCSHSGSPYWAWCPRTAHSAPLLSVLVPSSGCSLQFKRHVKFWMLLGFHGQHEHRTLKKTENVQKYQQQKKKHSSQWTKAVYVKGTVWH